MSDVTIIPPANDDGPICVECMRRLKITRKRLAFDANGVRAYWLGVELDNTRCEGRVLHTLIAAQGEFLSYRRLYDEITGRPGFYAGQEGDGYKSNVRSVIKRLRKKFLSIDPTFVAIVNYQSYGYAWKDQP